MPEEPEGAGHQIVAVVVHFYGERQIADCVRSCLEGTRVPDRLIVIDNGSRAGWRESFVAEFPRVEVIPMERNIGFAGALGPGLAEGLRLGDDDALLILNQDAELAPSCLELLGTALASERVAAACPTVVGHDGRIWARGGEYSLLTGRAANRDRGRDPTDGTRPAAPFDVDFAPGCAFLVRARAWRQAGGMDPGYFMFFEDIDLGARLRALGLRVVCEPRAMCRHEGSSAAGGEYEAFQSYFRLRNRFRFLRRNAGPWRAGFFAVGLVPLLLARDALRYARMGRVAQFREVVRGLLDFAGEPNPPPPTLGRDGWAP